MKSKILKVSITLAAIAGISAGLIGVVHAITAPVIANNAIKQLESQKKIPFGKDVDISDKENDLSQFTLSYVKNSWDATKDGTKVGTLFKTSGTNQYGSVTLLIGVYNNGDLTQRSILENSETYKSTLEDNYINLFNKADDKKAALNNVKCGATFGANLINSRISEAVDVGSGKVVTVTSDVSEQGQTAFGKDVADHYKDISLSAYKLTYVQKAYTASKGEEEVVGNLYFAKLKAGEEEIPVYLAITKDNKYGKMVFDGGYSASASAEAFVSGFNGAEDKAAYLDSLKGNGSASGSDITAGPTWPSDANKDDDSSNSGSTLDDTQAALKGFALEARSISNGTAEQDSRFACFESGEVDGFSLLSNASGSFIKKIDKATLAGKDVAYVYDLKGENDTQGGKKHREISFAIYLDGSLGKIAVIENGQTPSYYAPIKSKFIDAYNASSDRKAFLKQDRKSVVAGSSSGAQLLVDRRNEAIHDAEAR